MIIEVSANTIVPKAVLNMNSPVVFKNEGLLWKLNTIVNWEKSKFPKVGDSENREFLGKDPLLKSGNVFSWDGNTVAIDSEDTLLLVRSNSGQRALDRLGKEILFEYEINSYVYPEDLTIEVKDLPEFDIEQVISIPRNETARQILLKALGKEDKSGSHYKLLSLKSEDYDFPVEFIMSKHGALYYNPEDMDEICMGSFSKVVAAWSYEHQ